MESQLTMASSWRAVHQAGWASGLQFSASQTRNPLAGGRPLVRLQAHDKRVPGFAAKMDQILATERCIEGYSAGFVLAPCDRDEPVDAADPDPQGVARLDVAADANASAALRYVFDRRAVRPIESQDGRRHEEGLPLRGAPLANAVDPLAEERHKLGLATKVPPAAEGRTRIAVKASRRIGPNLPFTSIGLGFPY